MHSNTSHSQEHSARSAIGDAIAVRRLEGEAAQMRELQRVLGEAPDYALRVTGLPPGNADAQSVFTALPEGRTNADKFVFAIYRNHEMVGCADLIRGYPRPATAMLGLLLLSERHQRRGIGRRAYCLLEEIVRSWGSCERVRIGVVRSNEPVIAFWAKLGFTPTGEVRPYRHGSVASEVLVFEKPLLPAESRRPEPANTLLLASRGLRCAALFGDDGPAPLKGVTGSAQRRSASAAAKA